MGLLPVLSTATGLLLVCAGLAKIRYRSSFAASLREYVALPSASTPLIAWLVPVAEIAIGTYAISSPRSAWAVGSMIVLLIAFAVVVYLNLLAGNVDVSCGCFGKESVKLSVWTSARPLLIALLMVGARAAEEVFPTEDGRLFRRLAYAGAVLVAWFVVDRVAIRSIELRRAYEEYLVSRGAPS